jgi:tetratricopeptide (TPR) repeat protein
MSSTIFILIVGFSYIVLFGGLTLLRREGLSLQFAVEAIAISLLAAAASLYLDLSIPPVLFLFLLYVFTMRIRLLVELATLMAQQEKPSLAQKLFALAEHLFPDASNQLVIEVNRAVFLIKQNLLTEAVTLLKEILASERRPFLAAKYEAATHYNLGIAYLKLDQEAQAVAELNQAIETLPTSIYAHHAMSILEKRRRSNSSD